MRPLIFLILILFPLNSTSAASLKGLIKFNRELQTLKPHKTGKFKPICGPTVKDESIIANEKGLKNVVLTLTGKILKGGEPKKHILDQKKCRYEPHVVAMLKDSELKVLASDPVNHNIHTYSFDNDPINLMMTSGQDYVQAFEEPEVVKVECDLHHWMTAWVVVTDNPYYAISGDSGAFEILNIPPGKYKLTAWHETLGTLTQKVKVGKDDLKVDFDFTDVFPQVSQK